MIVEKSGNENCIFGVNFGSFLKRRKAMRKVLYFVMVLSVLGLVSGVFADVYHFHESYDSSAWKTRPEYQGMEYSKNSGGAYTYMVEDYTADDDGDGDLGELQYYAHENLKYEWIWHYYEFSQAGYLLSNPVVVLDGSANKGYGYGNISLAVWDGSNWNTIDAPSVNGSVTLTLDLTGDPNYQDLDVLRVRTGAIVDYRHNWPDAKHDWLDVTADMSPVPEPATIGLMLLGLVGLFRRR